MSVSNSMVGFNFASYLRAKFDHIPLVVIHHYETERPYPLPSHTMADRHPSPPMHHSMSLPSISTLSQLRPTPSPTYQIAPSRPTTITAEQGQPCGHGFQSATAETISPTTSLQDATEHWGLQPARSLPASSSAATHYAPLKTDSNVEPALPGVLPLRSSVDVSMYETIAMDDWITAPTEYDASSPSSLDTSNESPVTPGIHESDGFYGSSFNSQWSQYGFDFSHQNATMKGYSHPDYDIKQPESIPPSWICGPVNPIAHRLPSISTFFNPAVQSSVVPTALRNNRVAECATASPQDVELSTSISPPADAKQAASREQTPASSIVSSAHSDAEKEARQQDDEYLVHMRNQGYSYKAIKRLGGFTQAESTLRGRIRTLTKEKWERVRRPQWSADDVSWTDEVYSPSLTMGRDRSSSSIREALQR